MNTKDRLVCGIVVLAALACATEINAKSARSLAAKLQAHPNSQAAKGSGYPVKVVSGCVQQPDAFCKYITTGGVNYSAAVPKEVPGLDYLHLPVDIEPPPVGTPISGVVATLYGPSIKCFLSGVPGGVTGAILIAWKKVPGTCPKQ